MSRSQENEELLRALRERMDINSFQRGYPQGSIALDQSYMASVLVDISKSLASIADSLERR